MAVARLLAVAIAALVALGAGGASAEIGAGLVLDGIDVQRTAAGWEIQVLFGTLVRYLRHAPSDRGDTLEIQVSPIVMNPADAPRLGVPQSLAAPRGASAPLLDVTYQPVGRMVVLRFARPVTFAVRPSRNLRGLTISLPDAAPRAAPPRAATGDRVLPVAAARARSPRTDDAASEAADVPPSPPRPEPAPAAAPTLPAGAVAASAALLERGRAALTAGDADEAIRVFTHLLSLPASPASREAKELLGVARERRGQLAHARAEYEEYLALHPDGEGAERVRQRLDALLTARAALPPRGSSSDGVVPTRQFDVSGSVAGQYRREVRAGEAFDGALVADSSLFSDGLFSARLRTPGWNVRGQAAGSQLVQLADTSSGGRTRVSSLFVDAQQREGPWAGVVGRQSGNTGGVYGRVDGLRVSRRVAPHWRLGVVGGMPVEYWRSQTPDPGRHLYSLTLDAERLFERLDAQLYLVQQRADGFLDRTAAGLELRYAHESLFGAALLDYDVHYRSLNTAMLTGNWQAGPRSSLHLYVDHRNSPLLTTTNALIGQPEDRLDDLDGLSRSEIEQLAEDRTARSTLISGGGTRQLSERVQLALDASLSRLDGTPASGGVAETESTGWESSVYPQLIATNLFTDGEVTSLGVRWFDGGVSDTWSLILYERYPVSRRLRLLPRLRFDVRTREGRDEFSERPDDPDSDLPAIRSANRVRSGAYTLRPFLGLEYRMGRFTFDSDAGIEWTFGSFSDSETSASADVDEVAYILSLGLRYDF